MARSRRSQWSIATAVFVAAAASVGVAAWRWTSAPSAVAVADAPHADAIVVFVGGKGERLEVVHQLLDAGAAPNVVVPNGEAPGWHEGNRICVEPPDVRVFCPPLPGGDTRSEAELIGRLARENHWESVILVTSDYHVERARVRLDQCFDGAITTVAAASDLGAGERWGKVTHEVFGHLEARVFERGC